LQKKHISWTLEWQRVIFTNEKKFNLDGPDGIKYYCHHLRDEKNLLSHRQHCGSSAMVLAAFCHTGQVGFTFISGRINSADYQHVLEEHLLPLVSSIVGKDWLFLQDNAHIHRSRSTENWLQAQGILTLDFSARSSDLNPVENLWAHLVRNIYGNGRQYKTVSDLRQSIIATWNQTPQNIFQRLVGSIPDRMYDVVYNHDKSTKY